MLVLLEKKKLFILRAALNMEKLLCFSVRKQYFVFSRVQQRVEAKSIHEISLFLRRMNILFKMPSWIWPLWPLSCVRWAYMHPQWLKKKRFRHLKSHLKISKCHCIKYKDIKPSGIWFKSSTLLEQRIWQNYVLSGFILIRFMQCYFSTIDMLL